MIFLLAICWTVCIHNTTYTHEQGRLCRVGPVGHGLPNFKSAQYKGMMSLAHPMSKVVSRP